MCPIATAAVRSEHGLSNVASAHGVGHIRWSRSRDQGHRRAARPPKMNVACLVRVCRARASHVHTQRARPGPGSAAGSGQPMPQPMRAVPPTHPEPTAPRTEVYVLLMRLTQWSPVSKRTEKRSLRRAVDEHAVVVTRRPLGAELTRCRASPAAAATPRVSFAR